jgi:hypothetical protein
MNSNIQPALDALNSTLRELGADSVKSTLAKPRMALTVIQAAIGPDDGTPGLINDKDAEAIYQQYKGARTDAIRKNSMSAGMEDSSKSDAANTSKVRAHIKWGNSNTNAYEIAEHVIDLRKRMADGGEQVKDTYQALYDIAVKHNESPGKIFSDEELVTLIGKPGKKDKSELDKMVEEYKRLYRLAVGTEEAPGITAMVPVFDAICDVFDSAGIARPAMTSEEKKAEKAIAFLTSTGRVSVVTQ